MGRRWEDGWSRKAARISSAARSFVSQRTGRGERVTRGDVCAASGVASAALYCRYTSSVQPASLVHTRIRTHCRPTYVQGVSLWLCSILGYDSAQQNENKYNWTMVWPTTVHWNCVHDAKHYIQTVYKFSFNGCFLNASHKTKFFRAFSLNSQNSSVLSYQLKWFLQPQMKKLIPYHMLYTILFRFCV